MLEKFDDYMKNKTTTIKLDFCNEIEVNLKRSLSIQEEILFVNDVVDNAYDYDFEGNSDEYSPVSGQIAYELAFMKYFTDIPMATKKITVGEEEHEIIDNERMYSIYNALELNTVVEQFNDASFTCYINRLRKITDEAIKFKNDTIVAQKAVSHANDEAINCFSEVCVGLLKFIETANSTLDKNGKKILDKIAKSVSAKNVEKLLAMLPDDAKDLMKFQ